MSARLLKAVEVKCQKNRAASSAIGVVICCFSVLVTDPNVGGTGKAEGVVTSNNRLSHENRLFRQQAIDGASGSWHLEMSICAVS